MDTLVAARVCAWCKEPIPDRARRDSVCCSVRCRQAKHRFSTSVGVAAQHTAVPLRLAYADPPYPGRATADAHHDAEASRKRACPRLAAAAAAPT